MPIRATCGLCSASTTRMSKRYVHRVRVECDSCEAMVLAWDDELPEGWKEHVKVIVRIGNGKPEAVATEHRCPACATK